MEHKNIVATIYIKDGMAVKNPQELDSKMDVVELASVYDDSGVDKIICYDLSDSDEEHEKNILAIREINRNIEIKTAGGGNIKRLEDVKKLLYAGCIEVILNGSKPETVELVKEASDRFGPEKILVSLTNVDFLFKTKDFLEDNIHELLIMNKGLLEGLENITDIPYIVDVKNYDFEYISSLLMSNKIRGISGEFINDKSKYFGPYTSAGAVKDTIELINKLYKIRTCNNSIKYGVKCIDRPCLNYHIGQCLAPCQGQITEECYKEQIDKALEFLNGNYGPIIKSLEQQMNTAAEELDFEKAASLRDILASVKQVAQKQKIENSDCEDKDIIIGSNKSELIGNNKNIFF
mgnify:CR=1 FL=1